MKVFSKVQHNKSTPALQNIPAINTSAPSKSKHMTKLKTFKQILTQNAQRTANKYMLEKSCIIEQNNQDHHNSKSIHIQRSDDLNQTQFVRPNIKMISSFHCHTKALTSSISSSSNSSEKIQSVIYYGKPKETKALGYMVQNSSSENVNKLNMASRQRKSDEIRNQIHTCKQSEIKRINYYKNSKLGSCREALRKQWSMSNFRLGKKVGRGRFGAVYTVQDRDTNAIFALKRINLRQVKEENMEGQIMEEIKLQLFMNHPNVLKLYGFFRQGDELCLILEYAEGKCLFSRLSRKIDEAEASYYTVQMVKALQYCHSESILHRDLKPENILLCFNVAKLADFGWAAYAPNKRTTFCGTLDYVPPEIIKGIHYDEKVDIWSLGVLIYEMTTGNAPFECQLPDPGLVQETTMRRICEGNLKVPNLLSSNLRRLIGGILVGNPEKRFSLEEIERCKWIEEHQEEGIQIKKQIWDYWQRQ